MDLFNEGVDISEIDVVRMLLAGHNPMSIEGSKMGLPHEIAYPDDCFANFDFKLIDLFSEMRKHDPLAQRMRDEFWRLSQELGRRPERFDIYEGSDIPLSYFLKEDGLLGFLASIEQLSEEERAWVGTPGAEFLREIERTSMAKSYKMPTLLSFLDGGVRNIKPSLVEY